MPRIFAYGIRSHTGASANLLGYVSHGVREGAIGNWRDLLDERHLEELAPFLSLNRELGYPES
jgi:hypothetical protein